METSTQTIISVESWKPSDLPGDQYVTRKPTGTVELIDHGFCTVYIPLTPTGAQRLNCLAQIKPADGGESIMVRRFRGAGHHVHLCHENGERMEGASSYTTMDRAIQFAVERFRQASEHVKPKK